MKLLLQLFSLFLFAATAVAQQGNPIKETPLRRLCGKLALVKCKTIKGVRTSYTTDEKPVKAVALHLYEKREDTSCCQGLATVEDVVTDRKGNFKFKNAQPGTYWIAATVREIEYKLPVNFKPVKDADAACDTDVFALDGSGGFNVWEVITVD